MLDYPTRISHRHTVGRNGTGDYAAGSYDTVTPDRNSRQDNGSTSYPYIIFDFMGSANVLQMALLSSQFCMVLSFTFVECVAVYICTLEAIKTLLSISIRLLSTNVQFMLIMTLLPTNIFFRIRSESRCLHGHFLPNARTSPVRWLLFVSYRQIRRI